VLRFLARRRLGVIAVWAVTVPIFVGTEILPGDVATVILG
jgi:peptide/nickel transport system permease protein